MITFMNYIQMVTTNIKEKVMHKILPTVDILIHPPEFLQMELCIGFLWKS